MDEIDGGEKDDVKRKCRNLSEKKRRDQFNLLINELATMVAISSRKMDKSTVLKATIACFKNQKDSLTKCDGQKGRDDWQPPFLSNEEFTHLMLEALDGFIMTLSNSGRILYTSESITPLLGHVPGEVSGSHLCDLMPTEEQDDMRNFLSNPTLVPGFDSGPEDYRERYSIAIHVQRGSSTTTAPIYERIHITGYFERYHCPSEDGTVEFSCSEAEELVSVESEMTSFLPYDQSPHSVESNKVIFVGVARLEQPQLLREMIIFESTKSEFTSRHSLEWKFLFLDHRAPSIIGYLPFEVLGTSGYDYYHVDDLEKVSDCHEVLMKKGKGTSCFYRFLTKGQQWIWLRSHYYITYHQWNSKPEFIVCTNTVVSYSNIRNDSGSKEKEEFDFDMDCFSKSDIDLNPTSNEASSSRDESDSLPGPSNLLSQQSNNSQDDISDHCSISRRRHSEQISTSLNDQRMESLPEHEVSQIRRQLPQQHNQIQIDSSPGSPNSQLSSYSVPLIQNAESSGEPPPWSRRTKSVSSRYSSASVESDDCLTSSSKRSRLQFSHQRQHQYSRSYSSKQVQQRHHSQHHKQQDDIYEDIPPPSPCSDSSLNSHSSRSSSMHQHYISSRHYLSPKGKKNYYSQAVDFPGDLSQSLLSSHISKEGGDKNNVIEYMAQSTTTDSSQVPAIPNSIHSPSSRSGIRQPIHASLHQQSHYEPPLRNHHSFTASFNALDCNVVESSNSSHIIPASVPQSLPVVQVAAVPLTSVIPIQPVVTSHLVQISNPSVAEDHQQSIVMSFEQQQLQVQLKRKHSELQQHIMRQQEELRKVNQQLIMAQYGVNVQVIKEDIPNMQYNSGGESTAPPFSSDVNTGGEMCLENNSSSLIPISTSVAVSSGASFPQHQYFVSSSNAVGVQPSISMSSNRVAPSMPAIGVEGVAVPYQLSQQQAQMLFTTQRQPSCSGLQQHNQRQRHHQTQ